MRWLNATFKQRGSSIMERRKRSKVCLHFTKRHKNAAVCNQQAWTGHRVYQVPTGCPFIANGGPITSQATFKRSTPHLAWLRLSTYFRSISFPCIIARALLSSSRAFCGIYSELK